jgi:hypothetical protein
MPTEKSAEPAASSAEVPSPAKAQPPRSSPVYAQKLDGVCAKG